MSVATVDSLRVKQNSNGPVMSSCGFITEHHYEQNFFLCAVGNKIGHSGSC